MATPQALQAFVDRANEADRLIALLTERVQQLERAAASGPAAAAAAAAPAAGGVPDALLQQLQQLRVTLLAEQREAHQVRAERDRLLKENSKLEYRIVHLLRSLDIAEGREPAPVKGPKKLDEVPALGAKPAAAAAAAPAAAAAAAAPAAAAAAAPAEAPKKGDKGGKDKEPKQKQQQQQKPAKDAEQKTKQDAQPKEKDQKQQQQKGKQQQQQGGGKDKKADKPVESAEDKAIKAAYKEGGKKGQDIIGMSDMGGVKYFAVVVESANGDMKLLDQVLLGMNKEVDEAAEERKGGAGGLGKMLMSAGDTKLVIACHVPAELAKERELGAEEWLTEVLASVPGAKIVERSGDIVKAEANGDPAAGHFPLKMRDSAVNASFALLRKKSQILDDDDDDEGPSLADMADTAGIEW